MSRTLDLLEAVAVRLRQAQAGPGALFADVRIELDRYELGDLLKQSARTPAARVCFMRGKPALNARGGQDLTISVAVVVVAGRTGRPEPGLSSADAAVLDLMIAVNALLMADPYVGLARVSAADIGEQLVAVSDETGGKGVAIGLVEAAWTLRDVAPVFAAAGLAIGDAAPAQPPAIAITADGGQIAPEPSP